MGLTEVPVGPWADPAGLQGLDLQNYGPRKYVYKSTPGFSALFSMATALDPVSTVRDDLG